MKHKKFEIIMIKNTLAMMLPIMVLLLVLIFVGVRYSLFHVVQCYELTKIEPIEDQIAQLYSDGTTSVRYNAENLYYTGYNYLVENKIKGAYYYCFEDDHMVFLLIKTKQPQNSIDKRTVKGRIVKDEVVTDHIIAGLSKNGEVPMNILDGFYDSYVISEPDFPYVYTGIAYIIVAALSMLYVFVLAYVVRLWMRPYKNPQAKKLRAYGRRSAVIEQLNTELRDKLYFHYHGIYVTDNFLIATYWFHTDVIRLDDVRYLSKNRVEERSGRELYRLTLSEPETDLFYEIDFREEELIDACVDTIRG